MRLRDLPKVDKLAECAALAEYPAKIRMEAAREAIDDLRRQIMLGGDPKCTVEEIALAHAHRLTSSSLRPIINASGVILHTGLGRARLAPSAVAALHETVMHHANVELDLESGKRGDRQAIVRDLLKKLTGAEDALVVNNCAAAVFLSLHALANRKEVILSRGQMVEIGGSFRLPDIVRQSGCKLVEVGTTNRTRIEDYKNALTERTAAVLRCHPSNFKVIGFTEEPSASELAKFAHENGLIMIDDVGSGCLVDTATFGLPHEPTLEESLKAGADVVTSSGDKMLGGPQAGIILGKADAIKKIAKHPLARAVRIDKLTLAALEATLRLYLVDKWMEIPTLRYMSREAEEVKADAERFQQAYQGNAVVEEGITEIGGGSLPGSGVKTFRAGLSHPQPGKLAAQLRKSDPPVLARIEDDLVWLDPRTMEPEEVEAVERLLRDLK